MNICLLIISALIVNISSSLNCVGSPHALPCQCSLSKYGCSTNTNDCTWSFSKCISSSSLIKPDKDKTMQGDQEPSIQSSPPDPITIPSSTLVPLGNIFPTFGEPITNITCGDQVQNFWMQMPITFILTISTDIPSIIIDGCLSNFDTTLRLFGPDDLHTPIAADDDGCFDSSTGASIIDYKPSNGEIIKAGIYMLDLSSNVIRDEGIYNLDIQCGTFPPSKSPTPKPSRSPTSDDDQNESDSKPASDSKPSKDDSKESTSISDSDDQEWWMPTPRPTKGIFNDPTECTRNCDAFRIKLLYYGKISDYNTDTIYYDTIETDNDDRRRRRMQSSILNRGDSDDDEGSISNADASCYTYQVERLFDDGICSEKVEQIVLGACASDYNRVNHQDLDKLILREYGGDIYNGFSSFGKTEITGIQVDVEVDDDPVEFTLCMNGINDEGYTSDFVKFNREDIKGYLCNNAGNDGLPCLKDEYRNNQYQVQGDLFGAANNNLGGEEMHIMTDIQHSNDVKQEPSDTISNVLIVVLLLVITIMVFVAIFYLCVSREKSWLHSAVQKWTVVPPSFSWTATEDDDVIIGESSPFADYDGNNSNAECDGISLSSSLEFDENEHEIELCGMNARHRYNNNNLDEESRKLSAGSSSDKTISSLEKEPTHENKHYYKLSMDKSYRYRNKSSINLSGTSLLSIGNSPFSDDKIGILKEQMYEEIIEEASDDESEQKESSVSPTVTTSSSDVIFKDSTTQSSEDNNNLNESSSSPTATNASAATASPPARGNEHRDVERIIEKVFAKQVISPALISMNMDNMSMVSGSTSIDENDGTTILSVYDEYNNKSTTHQSQIYTISESKSVSENEDDEDNHNKVGKIGKSSTNNPNNSLLKEHEHEQTDLTANVINAVRYNGASAYYE